MHALIPVTGWRLGWNMCIWVIDIEPSAFEFEMAIKTLKRCKSLVVDETSKTDPSRR